MDNSSLEEFVHCSIACISAVRAWNANRKRYLTPRKNHPIITIHMPHRVGSLEAESVWPIYLKLGSGITWSSLQKGVSVQKIFTRVPSKVSSAKIRLSLGREDTQFPGMPPPPTSTSPTTTTTTATTSTTSRKAKKRGRTDSKNEREKEAIGFLWRDFFGCVEAEDNFLR